MTPTITTLPDGAYLIQVDNRRSIVGSAHLVDERIAQLSRPGWGGNLRRRSNHDHQMAHRPAGADR